MDKLNKVLITISVIAVAVLTVVSIHQWYLVLTNQGVI